MPWLGRKKIAFVPVFRPNAIPPDVIPADWTGDILRRVLYDPDRQSGADRSLRAYVHAASSGRADLDAVVRPMVVINQQNVPVEALEGQLTNRDGTGDVANPSVIGQGGWQVMTHLFSGGDGIIYAVVG